MVFRVPHSSLFEGCGFCRQPRLPAVIHAAQLPPLDYFFIFSGCCTLRFLKGAAFVVNLPATEPYPAARNCRQIISFAVAFASPRCTIHCRMGGMQ